MQSIHAKDFVYNIPFKIFIPHIIYLHTYINKRLGITKLGMHLILKFIIHFWEYWYRNSQPRGHILIYETSCSILEINLVFPRTHVLCSIYLSDNNRLSIRFSYVYSVLTSECMHGLNIYIACSLSRKPPTALSAEDHNVSWLLLKKKLI